MHNTVLSTLSQRTGLALDPARLQLSGEFRGRWLSVTLLEQGPAPGNDSFASLLTWIEVAIDNPDNLQLSVWPAGCYAYLVNVLLGAPEASSGDPDFDRRFIIKSAPRQAALYLLDSPAVRAALVGVEGIFHVELEGPELRLVYYQEPDDAGVVEGWLHALSDIADAVGRC